jgi:hypothetical protein
MREYLFNGVTYISKEESTCKGCAFESEDNCDNRPDCYSIIWVKQEPQKPQNDVKEQPKHRKQWEYAFHRMKEYSHDKEVLPALGAQGWELCAIDYGCFILKREKQQ